MEPIIDLTEDSGSDQVQPFSFNCVPDEIIENHIFGYFWFQYWIFHFISVCKRWKQICENTKMAPKHLRIISLQQLDLGHAILFVKKYQPTILELRLGECDWTCCYAIAELVAASDCIDTLIWDPIFNNKVNIAPSKALSKIRTLVWNATFSRRIFKLFPALKQLQTRLRRSHLSTKIVYPVEELTIIEPDDIQLENVVVPKLTIVTSSKVIQRSFGEIIQLEVANMTYEQYFRYFGRTKLDLALTSGEFADAVTLLETVTSKEYENDLYKGYFASYKYPTNQVLGITDYDGIFFSNCKATEAQQLWMVNNLPVSEYVKFVCYANSGSVKEALYIMSNYGSQLMARDENKLIGSALFKLLPPNTFADAKIRNVAKKIVQSQVQYAKSMLQTKKQFDDICLLANWSNAQASLNDADLFWAMLEKGAEIPCTSLNTNAIAPSPIVAKILQEINERDPSMWFDILESGSPRKGLTIMKQYGISPTIEKNGRSLWSTWYQNGGFGDDNTIKDYINHMDSSGMTPLTSAIKNLESSTVERFLKLGADPNKYRGDSLSPLAVLLAKCAERTHCARMLLILIKNGADINAPCLYEKRMCSPLMIAVLTHCSLPTLRLLIARGARMDYCDENGRSIMDCVTESQSTYERNFKALKWLFCTK